MKLSVRDLEEYLDAESFVYKCRHRVLAVSQKAAADIKNTAKDKPRVNTCLNCFGRSDIPTNMLEHNSWRKCPLKCRFCKLMCFKEGRRCPELYQYMVNQEANVAEGKQLSAPGNSQKVRPISYTTSSPLSHVVHNTMCDIPHIIPPQPIIDSGANSSCVKKYRFINT